jgi:hypothetical protein
MDGLTEHAVRTAVGFVCRLSAMIFAARLFEVSFPAEPDRPMKQVWLDYKIVAACLFMPWRCRRSPASPPPP